LPGQAAAVEQAGDFVEPFGVPRDEDQLEARKLGSEPLKGIQRQGLFRRLRAAGFAF
jgi:hypothetical protein